MSTLLGTTLSGRYRLDKKIGMGGMSTVYLATDEKLERPVAVKVMNQEVTTDSEQLERFRREARAVAQISHVNVVGVIDAGEDEGHPYIVFEYVRGETLKDRIRREGPLPVTEAVAYAIEVARALGAAHSHHIVHRDVKPQNVMIDSESGMAKVTDFGIARTLEDEGLTSDGRVIGTTDYVSPEQALGRSVTGQSDLYSLGIVLYEMLTGELPFQAEGQVAVAMKHVREPLPDVRAVRPEASATLASILERATAKTGSSRYGNDRQMITDLEQVLALEAGRAGQVSRPANAVFESLPANTRSHVPLSVRRRGFSAAVLALLACVVVAAIVVLIVRAENGHVPPGHGTANGDPTLIKLCDTCASAYNPDGYNGDIAQNNGDAHYAVDGNPKTYWPTQTYGDGLQKPGVGLYVRTAKAVRAAKLVLTTGTPGFDVKIYATAKTPDAHSFVKSGWQPVGAKDDVGAGKSGTSTIALNAGLTKYRYFLVWITTLPSVGYAEINEVKLYS